MCPVCMTWLATWSAGLVSAAGIGGALLVRLRRRKTPVTDLSEKCHE